MIREIARRVREGLAADGGGAVDVKGSAALAAALADHKKIQRDTVYVLPESEDAEENIEPVAVRQRCAVGITLALAVKNRRDQRGEAGLEEMDGLHQRVRKILLGWVPPGMVGGMEYRRGRLLTFTEEVSVWGDFYEAYGWINQV